MDTDGGGLDLSSDLTPEQAAAFLDMAMNGESPPDAADADNQAEATPESSQTEAVEADAVNNDAPDAADELAKAREAEQAARAEAEALRGQLAQQTESAPEAPQEEADPDTVSSVAAALNMSEEELVALFGDFSEQGLATGIKKLLDSTVPNMVASQVAEALKPLREQQEQQATDAHFRAIYEAHPDADAIVGGQEFDAWLKAQPSFAQEAAQQVLKAGMAAQVVELFSAFKAAQSAKQGETKPSAQAATPATLSDIPAGGRPATSADDALRQLPPEQLAEKFQDMSPEQIERFLNSV